MLKPLPGAAALAGRAGGLVGRDGELAELTRLLGDPACRLLTLTGPGGIGKTGLASEVAARHAGVFADGVVVVPLQAVASAQYLISAVADAVGVPRAGATDPRGQLLDFLQPRRLLLVLDNFEHLVEGVDLVTDMLKAAPEVRLLVTSRVVLNLQEEWIYPVGGLGVPPDEAAEAAESSSAVQLFVERARRVRRDFSLEAERGAVLRICRLTDGMPLAIELAAAWARTLPCSVIASEIERNLAFLATGLRNVPERHRSVRAAFDQSWRLLAEEERAVFRRLAVFQGGFHGEAAAEIA